MNPENRFPKSQAIPVKERYKINSLLLIFQIALTFFHIISTSYMRTSRFFNNFQEKYPIRQ